MSTKKVAELLVEALALAGVKRIYGVAGTPSTASRTPSANGTISGGLRCDTKRRLHLPPGLRRT
jgi:hypothetical protein